MSKDESRKGGKRKHGRNKKTCERYRLEGRREKNKNRRLEKRKRRLEKGKKKKHSSLT